MLSHRDDVKVDIICRDLIGNLRGIGETYADERTLYNLELAEGIISNLLYEIYKNAEDDRVEFSIQKINEESRKILKRIKLEIDYVLQEEE